jgi:hypothetical protein
MAIYFRNSAGTGSPLWVAFTQYYPPCGPSPNYWLKRGWYQVPSGGTVNVWNVTADGQKIFYYAEDAFGNIWGNDPNTDFFTQIPWQAFSWCWNTGSTTSRVLGLRKRIIPNPTPNGDWFFNLTA